MYRRLILLLILLAAAFFRPLAGFAQGRGVDTIAWSSTCVNTQIIFSSPLLDTFFEPDYIKWHFGDPSSGYNDSSAGKKPKHIFASPGSYTVELDVWYRNSDTIKIMAAINTVTPMNFSFGPDIYVCGKAPDTLLQGPVVAGAVYTWNDADTTHTDTMRVKRSGVYTVAVNGCGVTDSIGVYASDTPKIDLGKDHIMCDSANLQLNAASQNGTYAWLLNGMLLPGTTGQIFTHAPGGTYVAVVTVPGCGVYRDTVSVTYSQPLAPPFDLGPDTLLCPKQVYRLNAAFPGATAYDWSTESRDSLITITDAGEYWVFVTYQGRCQVTDTVDVTYRNDRPLAFNDTAICQGSTLVLNADFGQGTYKWSSVPPQRDDQNQTGQSTYFVYRPGTYAVLAQVGQCVYSDTLTVSFDDSLRVRMITDTTLCYGEDFMLTVQGNADTYAWQDSSHSAFYRPTQPGIYTVVATNGCGSDTLTATVNFSACSCQLLLPNAFTPNGDGRNDTFRPLHACEMTNFEMQIYDRLGELVFRSLNPDQAWDGTYHGRKVSTGAFVWMASYFSTETKQPVFKKGTVMVIR
jgi:gliding motility-associated-like protein